MLDALLAIATLRFDVRLALAGDGGPLDAIAASVNMLAEEMAAALEERDLARSEVEQNNRLLDSVLQGIADAVMVVDASGRITLANAAGQRLLGHVGTDRQRERLFARLPILDADGVTPLTPEQSPAGRALRGETVDDALIVVHLPGAPGPASFRVTARPLTGADGTVTGCVTVTRDVTRAQEQAQALARATRAAEDATRAKSSFLANMSHEIRTPMTAILGFVELLEDTVLDQDARRAHLRVIRRSAEHLLALLDDVLDMSRVEAGALVVERIPCSPGRILLDVVALMQVRARTKGLSLGAECASPIPLEIESDPTRLRQILLNLVGNAIKFTEQGGVRIVVGMDDGDQGSTLRVSIVDTGPGIAPDKISGLFRPFQQLDASTTRRYGGSGLGLAVSKRLAELLGGELGATSEPGHGSTFTLTLPVGSLASGMVADLDDPSLSPPLAPAVGGARLEPGTRVLLAEDGPDNQALLRAFLERAGASVTVVEDGGQAVEQAMAAEAEARPFAAILMDMQMPVMDGYEATAKLRARGFARPIIALTAHAMTGDRERCLAAGCDDYLPKPVERAQLVEVVARRVATTLPPASVPAEAEPQGTAAGNDSETSGPITSTLAGDPEMVELIAKFASALGGRRDALTEAAARDDWVQVQRLARQLRGSGSGYGFAAITEHAAELERAAIDADASTRRARLETLLGTLERVRAGSATPAPTRVQGETVLVIDDDPQIHDLVEARLRPDGIGVHGALDAEQGLALARELRPDVILLDVSLGATDGFEVCRRLQDEPTTAALPVLFLTAADDPRAKLMAYHAGATDYLVKPFETHDLRVRVRAALRTKRYQDLLAQRASVDGLTGLGNRAAFDERLRRELEGARRYGRELSLVMLDVDHFKQLNDRHGHPFGDDVLRAIATLLARQLRVVDAGFRYGGEELAVLATATGAAGARSLAEKLRRGIAALELRSGESPVRVTASFGVASSAGVAPAALTPALLLARADAALYQAKRTGRNRVCVADDPTQNG